LQQATPLSFLESWLYQRISPFFFSPGFIDACFVLSGGASSTYAVTSAGDLYAWGANEKGQLGVGDLKPKSQPVKVRTAGSTAKIDSPRRAKSRIVKISAGQYHCCAISSTGHIYCWGCNSHGQLGHPRSTIQSAPELVGGRVAQAVGTAVDICCAPLQTFVLAQSNKLFLFGNPSDLQRALNMKDTSSVAPKNISSTKGIFRRALHNSLPMYVLERDVHTVGSDAGAKFLNSLHCCWSSSISSTWIKQGERDATALVTADQKSASPPLRNEESPFVNEESPITLGSPLHPQDGPASVETSRSSVKDQKSAPHTATVAAGVTVTKGKEGTKKRKAAAHVRSLVLHWERLLELFSRSMYCDPAYPRNKGWMSSLLKTFKVFRKLGIERGMNLRTMQLILADQNKGGKKKRVGSLQSPPPDGSTMASNSSTVASNSSKSSRGKSYAASIKTVRSGPTLPVAGTKYGRHA
jgi:hypothetical protein